MNRKCKRHCYNECEFLYLNSSSKDMFICTECIDESNGYIKLTDCVALKQILEADSQTILNKYPPLSSLENNQIVYHFASSIDTEIKQVKDYYQNLFKQYQIAVNKAMAKSKAQIDELKQVRESFIKQYTEIAQIEQLKQLVQMSQNDGKQDDQLRNFINIKSKQAAINTILLLPQVKKLQEKKESFSNKQPEKLESRILKQIEQISFFINLPSVVAQIEAKNVEKKKKEEENVEEQEEEEEEEELDENPLVPTVIVNSSSSVIMVLTSIMDQITIAPLNNGKESKNNLQIYRNKKKQIITKNIGAWGQCTFESILDPKKNYLIRLQTLIWETKDPSPLFYFGIMPYELRHNELVDDNGICYNECKDCDGISTMLKGDNLHLGENYEKDKKNYWRTHKKRRFEVRINLENKIVKVGQFPDYALVAEIDDTELIDLSLQYTFTIKNIGYNNIIAFEDICEVNEFDGLM